MLIKKWNLGAVQLNVPRTGLLSSIFAIPEFKF